MNLHPQTWQSGHLRLSDDLMMHYRDYPGGSVGQPPLLCLHGLTRNSRDFAEFAHRYAPRFRVIAPDFRGRGLSDPDPHPERYNPLTYTRDVLELLDALAVPEAIFVGTSLGGLVTMAMTALAADRIGGAILNDIGPELNPAGLDRIMAYVGDDKRFSGWSEAARAIADNHGGIPDHFTEDDWHAMARRLCREEGDCVVYDYDMAIALPFRGGGATPTVDLWPFFGALAEKPLLVVHGQRSDLVTEEAIARMREAAPGAHFVDIPGVGHAPTLSECDAVAAIDQFLARWA